MYRHSVGTIWRRALRRVDRRKKAYFATRGAAEYALLTMAVRLSNLLAVL